MRPAKTWLTVALFAGFATIPYASPGLSAWRLVRPSEVTRVLGAPFAGGHLARILLPTASPSPLPTPAPSPTPTPAPRPSASPLFLGKDWPAVEGTEQARGIEDPAGAMAGFYEALGRAKQGEGVARVSHFGDSPVVGDLITADARRGLQAVFGDAGHGWIFPDRPWEWYGHRGVDLTASGWDIVTPFPPRAGRGPSGFGGVRFESRSHDTASTLATAKKATVSRFEVHYLAQAEGGTLLASVDDAPPLEIPTHEGTGTRVHAIPVEDGAHALTLRPKGDGLVSLFGVVLERDRPGVVYDSLGANGVTVGHLARLDGASWVEGLRRRRPDLVVLNFGTNESGYAFLPFDEYARHYHALVRRIREALPECSILIMAPMDRAYTAESGELATMPTIPRLVAGQRTIAEREGVAFFNTYAAMGGKGTMLRWYEADPRLATGDLTHPTFQGADLVAGKLVAAILEGYRAATAPPPSPPASPGTVTPGLRLSPRAPRGPSRPGPSPRTASG